MRKKKKKKPSPVFLVAILIILVGIAGVAAHMINRYIPSREPMDLYEYYGYPQEGEAAIVIGSSILEERGVLAGENAYIPLDVVNTYLNARYYWDEDNQQIIYASPLAVQYFPASAEAGTEVWQKDGSVFLSLPFVRMFTDLDSYVYQDPDRIAIRNRFEDVTVVTSQKRTSIRQLGGIKSKILTDVPMGVDLTLLEELDNWYKVASDDGYIGYVQKKDVSIPAQITLERADTIEDYTYLTMDVPVNMVWHNMEVVEANAYFQDMTQSMTGVNVISPTWFFAADTNGNLTNISSADYVQAAHAKGLKVWALVNNFHTQDLSTYELLRHTASRQNLISQLIQGVLAVGADGVNVDFEYLSEDAGPHFLEFLRELSIECHRNNLVLSVDNPVPEDFSSHYDRAEQGKIVDYIIIMGYDEHYLGSDAGSVASLPWVEQGIIDTIAEVPAARVINAVPFYTRVWKTLSGTLSSEAVSMPRSYEIVQENNVNTYWDNVVSQNVAVYEKDGASCQIWLEDASSIAEKVRLIPKYGLAGVAAWRLGLEDNAIWQVITDNLSGGE